jgi:hypothetical protein
MNELSSRIATLSPEQLARLSLELKARKGNRVHTIPRRADGDRCLLSFAQQRLWFLYQLEPESAVYNCPAAMRFTGALNLAALAQSFNEVVRRHEVLRTRFSERDGDP